jgi:hypothetical protein
MGWLVSLGVRPPFFCRNIDPLSVILKGSVQEAAVDPVIGSITAA